ncbi:putative ankyrin repeat protein RF_0381 [Belonocnema kinseyi]|uniref:putative ankyrin repeat protein RF_0381 n=1 Tax=Belonocnema kinseyi TaxID=2817044 RepID=UPI00143D9054|nr:putative ankyrin repeat protein RF_0381 [Belonocnema kinseyi]
MSNSEEALPELFKAVKNGDEQKVKSLMSRGVDISRKLMGSTVLHAAASFHGNANLVDLFCNNSNVLIDEKDSCGFTPLHIAVSKNNFELVRALLHNNANPKRENNCGLTPFQVALKNNFKHIAMILLNSATLLDICSWPAYPDPEFADQIFNACLNRGNVDLNQRDFENRTSLHFAALYGRDNQVKQLIQLGANVNLKSSDNETPLHMAARKRHVETVEVLLNFGAYVNYATNAFQATPLHYVCEVGKYPPDPKVTKFRDPEWYEKSEKIMKILLKRRANVKIRDIFGKTALHYAVGVMNYRPGMVSPLLDAGADVNATGKEGLTPIFYAINEMILWMLIKRGAEINYVSKKEFTPLSHAIKVSNSAMVEILLENGADVNIQNSAGKTVIEIHEKWLPEILEAIINKVLEVNSVNQSLVRIKFNDNSIPIIVKKKVAGEIIIDEEDLISAGLSQDILRRIRLCEMEILDMKEVVIKRLGLSFFDLLLMPIGKLASMTVNEEILQLLELERIRVDFPLSATMLQRHVAKARKQRLLKDSCAEAIRKLIFSLWKIELPCIVVQSIIRLLNNTDLNNLMLI